MSVPDGPLPRTLGGEAAGTADGRPVLVAGEGLGAARDGVWAQAAVVPEQRRGAAPGWRQQPGGRSDGDRRADRAQRACATWPG